MADRCVPESALGGTALSLRRVWRRGPAPDQPPPAWAGLGLVIAYALAWALVAWAESPVWPHLGRHPDQILIYLVNARRGEGVSDTTWMLPLLVLAPVAWLVRDRVAPGPPHAFGRRRRRAGLLHLLGGISVLVLGIATAMAVGRAIGPLPPVFHDEYSYLFQARTFLAGRLWFPSHPLAAFFDQVHVLNDGHFASRYFPGTGLWLAGFVWLGRPYWGYWLATGLIGLLTTAVGLEFLPAAAAWLAGLLVAVTPAVPVFGNLLLAHHPTLLGLGVFLLFFFRGQRTGLARDWALAGLGMGYAFLCRPLTAFGIGLPFAVYALGSTVRAPAHGAPPRRWRRLAALVVPFGLCAAALLPFDRSITGSVWQTPSARYNAVWTPRNVYGFYNVQRGSARRRPGALEAYDAEAKDLQLVRVDDPARQVSALANGRDRITSMAQSTLGIVPLLMIAVLLVVWLPWKRDPWWLLVLALVSLHAVHLPYYYAGIFYWHYVFESVPLVGLLAAGVTADLAARWRHQGRWLMLPLWLAMLAVGVATCWINRGGPMIDQVRHGRGEFARFNRLLAASGGGRNSLVFVADDPQVHHIGLVVNHPDLGGPVVRAHHRGLRLDTALMRSFPDRRFFLYVQRQGTGRLIRLPSPDKVAGEGAEGPDAPRAPSS